VAILEIVVVILLVLLNGFFAMSELAIVSSRQRRLERLAADGSSGASAAPCRSRRIRAASLPPRSSA
jgi:CBS domain containing-hemolysin-like protein